MIMKSSRSISRCARVLPALPDESFEFPIDVENASYFLSTIDLVVGEANRRTTERGSGMAGWRRRLFIATAGLTADAAEYFNLPRDRTVIIGSRISLRVISDVRTRASAGDKRSRGNASLSAVGLQCLG